MPGARPQRDQQTRLASGQTRGTRVPTGSVGVVRVTPKAVQSPSNDDVWVEVEPVADIAAKGHAYISFDPA